MGWEWRRCQIDERWLASLVGRWDGCCRSRARRLMRSRMSGNFVFELGRADGPGYPGASPSRLAARSGFATCSEAAFNGSARRCRSTRKRSTRRVVRIFGRTGSTATCQTSLRNAVTTRVWRAPSVGLPDWEERRSLRERPDNPDAMDYVLRALAVWNAARAGNGYAEIRRLLETAVRIDPQSIYAQSFGARSTSLRLLISSAMTVRRNSVAPRQRSSARSPWRQWAI